MLFKKHLKKSPPQQEAEFRERMETVPLLDKVIMVLTAFGVIVVPCLLILCAMVLVVSWILGLL